MGKKFIFNPENLTFEVSKFSLKKAIKSILPHFFVTIVFSGILGYALFNNVKTPEQSSLEFKNQSLCSKFEYLDQQINIQIERFQSVEKNDKNTYRTVLGISPSTNLPKFIGSQSIAEVKEININENSFIDNINLKSELLSQNINSQAESFDELLHFVKNQEDIINSIPSICPLANNTIHRIGSGFGYRMHPILHVLKMHTGVDISAEIGTPVYATGNGIVISADMSDGGYGQCIRINHGFTYVTVYAHLSKILVSPGEFVKRGQLIGLVGNTGRSTSPHLHYEVRINNQPVNPENFFYLDMTDEEYQDMVNQAMVGKSKQ